MLRSIIMTSVAEASSSSASGTTSLRTVKTLFPQLSSRVYWMNKPMRMVSIVMYHHQHLYNYSKSFHTCCPRGVESISNNNNDREVNLASSSSTTTTTSENNKFMKLGDHDENIDTNILDYSVNTIQLLRDPSSSANLRDFMVDTIIQKKHKTSERDHTIGHTESSPNQTSEARQHLESVRDRLREKFGNKLVSQKNTITTTTTQISQQTKGLSNATSENSAEETTLKNVEFMKAIKHYENEIAKNDKLPCYETKWHIENYLRKQFKRGQNLSTILNYFVKYPEITRTGQFYTIFLETIAMSLPVSKKMSLETVEKIFEKIPSIDVSPDTYRALILCYANKGKLDAIPALLDKMDSLLETGFFRAQSVPLKIAKESYESGKLSISQSTDSNHDDNISTELLQELFMLEMFKLKLTFEAFAHNHDLNALEKLIIMKRSEWLSNHHFISTYIKMVNDSLEFYLTNNKYLHAKKLVDLFYKYDLPRSSIFEKQLKLDLTPDRGNSTLFLAEKPAHYNRYARFFNLQLLLYKELSECKLNSKLQEHSSDAQNKREYMSAQKLFDMTIAEMKKEGITFTSEIYLTICAYYYSQQAYERCVFFFEDALRHGVVPKKRSFIYAEESYLVLNDIKKAMQCHQLRDVYYRLFELNNEILAQGAAACLDYLYNYKDKKTQQAELRKRKEQSRMRKEKEEEVMEEEELGRPVLASTKQSKAKKQEKKGYTLSEVFLSLTKKQ
ncbi:hypothetical protein C9374_000407 [Naegleria lovaniensis]|uniref:Uncharacterized protein n=1 Tax=Naegleria lovaniensis TaxID=51637 RepID=A0AA88GZ11_NAELO|nr:uncharacterized protein C9374_000407 [Naegleria lovaniensis]KAG2388243.1 hypothetical protein C9374_000407 [Naegleria lovaniensis]